MTLIAAYDAQHTTLKRLEDTSQWMDVANRRIRSLEQQLRMNG